MKRVVLVGGPFDGKEMMVAPCRSVKIPRTKPNAPFKPPSPDGEIAYTYEKFVIYEIGHDGRYYCQDAPKG